MNRASLTFVALVALCGSPLMAQGTSSAADGVTRPPVVHQLRWIPADVLRGLLGGHNTSDYIQWGEERPQRLWINERLNTISLQGTPQFENFVESMIKRFDVKPATIEFQFHVLKASTGNTGLKDGLPPFVKKVVAEIGALTRYNSFELIDSPLLRATAGNHSEISGEGTLAYSIHLRPAQVVDDGSLTRIRVDGCDVTYRVLAGYTSDDGKLVASPETVEKEMKEMKQRGDYRPVVKPLYRSAGVNTSFTIEDGETIVLGASRIPQADASPQTDNWAIVTVLTAHILK